MSFLATNLIGFGERRRIVRVTSGIVGWWKFEDGSGTSVADSSGNSRTGTLVGSPTWDSGAGGGGAVSFNGSSQYMTAADHNDFSPATTNKLSVCAWFYATATTGFIAGKTEAATNYEWGLSAAGITFWQSLGAGHAAATAAGASTGVWTHVAGTYDNGVAVIAYRNGVSVASSTSFSGSVVNGAGLVNIGRRPDDTNYFNGIVDDFRIYNRVLTAAEVALIANMEG